jgi:hypothetical protein
MTCSPMRAKICNNLNKIFWTAKPAKGAKRNKNFAFFALFAVEKIK